MKNSQYVKFQEEDPTQIEMELLLMKLQYEIPKHQHSPVFFNAVLWCTQFTNAQVQPKAIFYFFYARTGELLKKLKLGRFQKLTAIISDCH